MLRRERLPVPRGEAPAALAPRRRPARLPRRRPRRPPATTPQQAAGPKQVLRQNETKIMSFNNFNFYCLHALSLPLFSGKLRCAKPSAFSIVKLLRPQMRNLCKLFKPWQEFIEVHCARICSITFCQIDTVLNRVGD